MPAEYDLTSLRISLAQADALLAAWLAAQVLDDPPALREILTAVSTLAKLASARRVLAQLNAPPDPADEPAQLAKLGLALSDLEDLDDPDDDEMV